jgi:cysteine desulfurase/selenocysteine lyase
MPTKRIHLDNASTSWPKPPGVAWAMAEFLRAGAATPGRGGYSASADAERAVGRLRRRLAGLVGARAPERMILLPSATEALNTAILGLFSGRSGAPARVVTTGIEHNSVTRVLHYLAERGVVKMVSVPPDADGFVSPEAVRVSCDARTALVVISHVSNVLGTIQPITEIAAAARRAAPEVLVLVDACQSMGLLPIDVEGDGIDLTAFSGHKALLGPSGVGGLYVGPRAFPGEGGRVLEPTRFGGTGTDSTSADMPADLPARFEPGTPNTVGQIGLLAAIEDPTRLLPDAALAHERMLVDHLVSRTVGMPRVRVVGPRDRSRCVGILSLVVEGHPPTDVAAVLDASFGIAVRAGLQCAPGAHRAMGTFEGGGTVRVSPGPYSTLADIEALADALGELASG